MQRQRDDLAGQRRAELRELAFKAAVEVSGVGDATGEVREAVHHESFGPVQLSEDA